MRSFGRVIEEKNRIPKEIKEKNSSLLFSNVFFAVVIFVYLGALNLGMSNIPTENYLMDLKVFSILLLGVTIILFELAYNKDKSELWLHGIEVMGVSIFTVYLIYFYSIYFNTFGNILFSFAFAYFIYYVIKVIIMRRRTIKNYKNSTDIGEIVKKKE